MTRDTRQLIQCIYYLFIVIIIVRGKRERKTLKRASLIRIQRRTVANVRTDMFRSEPRQRCNGVLHAHLSRSPGRCVRLDVAGFCVSAGVPHRCPGRAYRRIVRFQTAAKGNDETFTDRAVRLIIWDCAIQRVPWRSRRVFVEQSWSSVFPAVAVAQSTVSYDERCGRRGKRQPWTKRVAGDKFSSSLRLHYNCTAIVVARTD